MKHCNGRNEGARAKGAPLADSGPWAGAGYCKRPAGWGVPGTISGRCKRHGGASLKRADSPRAPVSWRNDLRTIMDEVSADELPDLIGELARAEAIAHTRLHENGQAEERPAPDIQPADQLIDTAAAAKLLGVKLRWLYDRADGLPFTRRIGPRTLRFDEAGLHRWLETRR